MSVFGHLSGVVALLAIACGVSSADSGRYIAGPSRATAVGVMDASNRMGGFVGSAMGVAFLAVGGGNSALAGCHYSSSNTILKRPCLVSSSNRAPAGRSGIVTI